MADPLDYTLVRLDNNIKDKALLAYDAVNDKLFDSGLTAPLSGGMQAAAGTVSVGIHSLSSSGDQITFTNQTSKVTYAPPWHVVDESSPGGSYDRFYGPKQPIVRFSERSTIVTNPVMNVYIPVETLALSFDFTWPEAQQGVVMEWYAGGSPLALWRDVRDVSQGVQDEVFPTPLAYHAGNYVFKMYRLDGEPLKVMGDPVTGYAGYGVTYREFSEKQLATQEYVQEAVKTGGTGIITGDMLKSVYDKDDKGYVDRARLADKITGIDSAPHSTYYGVGPDGSDGFYPLPSSADIEGLGKEVKDLQSQVSNVEAQAGANKVAIDKHTTAIEGHGVQLAAHAKSIAINDNNSRTAIQTGQSALAESTQVRNMMPNQITADVDHTSKTITLHLLSKSGYVDSVVLNLSSWFTGGSTPQPGVTHKLYYGFTQNPPMSEDEILRLSQVKTVDALAGTELTPTRQGSTPKYMYVWIPDTAGTVKGFTFSGFLSTWQSTAVNVAGINGKFFVSPNRTSAQTVTFEVTV
ncbi:hypothetical protein MQM1_08 [Aeromonas phage vB_AsaP_MQM1]|nr:hypothetical protein MQM1_08 [Aeromonas phage vB_AsaP_MQM1]